MQTFLHRGRINRPEGDTTFYTELEINLDDNIIITIRRYTSRTFVAINNKYHHFTKITFKDYHNMFSLGREMKKIISKYKLFFTEIEKDTIREMYRRLEVMPIISKDEIVF